MPGTQYLSSTIFPHIDDLPGKGKEMGDGRKWGSLEEEYNVCRGVAFAQAPRGFLPRLREELVWAIRVKGNISYFFGGHIVIVFQR